MKTATEILSRTEIVGLPLLSSETLRSPEPNSSESESAKSGPTLRLPLGPENQSQEFRRKLLQLDESHHPKVANMALAAEWYVRALSVNDISRGRSIVFSGSPGCGKTKVARRIYKFSSAWGADLILAHRAFHWASLWVDWPKVAESDDESDFSDISQQIESATLVVLDDVGSESDRFKNGVPASRLRRVLTSIEKQKIWCVVTTNLSKEKMLDNYDARGADRLEAFQWMELGEVPSYRRKLIA